MNCCQITGAMLRMRGPKDTLLLSRHLNTPAKTTNAKKSLLSRHLDVDTKDTNTDTSNANIDTKMYHCSEITCILMQTMITLMRTKRHCFLSHLNIDTKVTTIDTK
jgi:hypothetical protein